MKSALSRWARACLLIAVILVGPPLDAGADGAAGEPTAIAMDDLLAADSCCRAEADSGWGSECLPVCGGPVLTPTHFELALLPVATTRPEPDLGAGTRFEHLEPHPPKRLSDPI